MVQERQNQKELSEKKKCGCCGNPLADGKGATCPECNHQVCQKCQTTTEGASGFYCTLCSKEKYVGTLTCTASLVPRLLLTKAGAKECGLGTRPGYSCSYETRSVHSLKD